MLSPDFRICLWRESPEILLPREAGEVSRGSEVLEPVFPEGTVRGEACACSFTAGQRLENMSLQLVFHDPEWKKEDYLLIPAAVYDANRFRIKKVPYPPMFSKEDYALDPPVTVTDIPHFSLEAEESTIALRAGDASVPAVFLYHRTSGTARAFLYECRSAGGLGENGVELTENSDGLCITIMNPIVRRHGMYRFGNISSTVPCEDLSGTMEEGQQATLKVWQYEFHCETLSDFYRFVLRLSHEGEPVAGSRTIRKVGEVPSLKGGFRLVEKKYNDHSWRQDHGFYCVGEGQNLYATWQTGWVGGINAAYALYRMGNPISRGRAIKTMDFMLRKMHAPTGFLYGVSDGEHIYGDDFADIENKAVTMVRKNADALYFTACILKLMKERRDIPDPFWREALRGLADAFVRLFHTYGQLGQILDVDTGEILVGGSAAGGLVPAGLTVCAAYFDEPAYLEAAQQIAEVFDRDYTRKGLANGGPGEILSAPDSESAYALLESYTTLYEATGKTEWLEAARRAADIYATWCMPYDYPFPEQSMFGQAGMRTTGAVWANVQNKHGAPGPCTFSGSALLRLSRYTSDPVYGKIGRETIHNISQYLSTAKRPLWNYDHSRTSPPGFMCERVSTSDWEGFDKIGGVYETGCWCEATLLLMAAEGLDD